jgi:hypothetical protein
MEHVDARVQLSAARQGLNVAEVAPLARHSDTVDRDEIMTRWEEQYPMSRNGGGVGGFGRRNQIVTYGPHALL